MSIECCSMMSMWDSLVRSSKSAENFRGHVPMNKDASKWIVHLQNRIIFHQICLWLCNFRQVSTRLMSQTFHHFSLIVNSIRTGTNYPFTTRPIITPLCNYNSESIYRKINQINYSYLLVVHWKNFYCILNEAPHVCVFVASIISVHSCSVLNAQYRQW